ncbi:MAG: acyl-CoA dehydrogenase family protein [Nitrospirae bacterium]|nr:acyl-CoA dehydrogenase family protein [Nitrospirota bacterium]
MSRAAPPFPVPDEALMLKDSLGRYLTEEVLPIERSLRLFEEDDIPEDVKTRVRKRSVELGFYGIHMPQDVGGGGIDALTLALLKQEVGRQNSILGSEVLGGFGGPTHILLDCTPTQREKFLAPLMRGDKTCCFGLSEPGAGSDATAIQTRAAKTGDRYVLNGTKHFITNGPFADFAMVFAVTDKEKRARGGITCFLVEKGTPGFRIGRIHQTMAGKKNQCELIFEDCEVPEANVLGRVGYGFASAMKWISHNRVAMSAYFVGVGEFLVALSIQHARTRVAFGKPIAEQQGIQWMLADMAGQVHAARCMLYSTAWMLTRGQAARMEASLLKLNATEMICRVVDTALQIHGGMGFMRDLPIERIYRTARAGRIGEGTSEILKNTIARELLEEG